METRFNTRKISRRNVLKTGIGALGVATFGGIAPEAFAHTNNEGDNGSGRGGANIDVQVLNFALNLEYLEAEYYTYATTGRGIEVLGVDVDGRGTPGEVIVKENPVVPFSTPEVQQYALEIADDERDHVHYIRSILSRLGNIPAARPVIDLRDSFTAAAVAAGIINEGETFDPFADELSFLLGAFIFEDVGVTAYRGAAPRLTNKDVLSGAAGILAAEAYHSGNIRTKLYEMGEAARDAAQKISDLRDSVDGPEDRDQGLVLNEMANIVPTNANGLAFARNARQVLNIVFLQPGAAKGGFFPNGINL